MQEDTKQDPGHVPAVSTEAPRPIEVGDYVRWERIRSRDSWIEGEISSITSDGNSVNIKVDSFGCALIGVTAGRLQQCDGPRWKESTAIRRIPRPAAVPAPDALDIEYDRLPLRNLLRIDDEAQREDGGHGRPGFTPAQRAAVSAYWSAELRAKVAASAAADKARSPRVVVELQDEP